MVKVQTDSMGHVLTSNGGVLLASEPTLNSLIVSPSISEQTFVASNMGADGFSTVTAGAVTSSIDANITASNIVSGVTILGVTGNATVLNGTTINVTPSTLAQTITPTSPYNGITSVNVSAVTSSIDANITAGNIKDGVTILGVTGSYQGSGGGTGSSVDVPLTRVTDDNNNEIGTHYMNFKDGNGNVYEVVLLDAQYRLASGGWCDSTSSAVTNMPIYADLKNSNVYEASETATTNTQLILDYCTANNYTSGACSHCRTQSFTINGTTYYGQLPNLLELVHLLKRYNDFDALDDSATTSTTTNFSASRTLWSSSQNSRYKSWWSGDYGIIDAKDRLSNALVCPVLEIPVSNS